MFASLVIVFREVFEAGLIVGIVMAVTSGVAGRTLWIAGGVAAGVLGACAVALFTSRLSALFDGSGQEIFNASILSFAVLMLTWHNVWMARHGRELAAEIRAAGQAVVAGSKSLAALALVVAIAVLREGSEVVLFLYGVAAAGGGGSSILVGSAIGLLLGTFVCLLTYFGLVAIPIVCCQFEARLQQPARDGPTHVSDPNKSEPIIFLRDSFHDEYPQT